MAEEPCINDGLFCRIMVYLFGASWKTSFYSTCAIVGGGAELVQTYLVNIGAAPGVCSAVGLFFGYLALLNAKDKNVTGGSITSK